MYQLAILEGNPANLGYSLSKFKRQAGNVGKKAVRATRTVKRVASRAVDAMVPDFVEREVRKLVKKAVGNTRITGPVKGGIVATVTAQSALIPVLTPYSPVIGALTYKILDQLEKQAKNIVQDQAPTIKKIVEKQAPTEVKMSVTDIRERKKKLRAIKEAIQTAKAKAKATKLAPVPEKKASPLLKTGIGAGVAFGVLKLLRVI